MNIIRLNSIGEPFAKSGQATPPSGGGSTSSWRYFDTTNLNPDAGSIMGFFYLFKRANGFVSTWGSLPIKDNGAYDYSSIVAIAADGESKIAFDGKVLTWNEVMVLEGMTPEIMSQVGIAEITEEQFYTL